MNMTQSKIIGAVAVLVVLLIGIALYQNSTRAAAPAAVTNATSTATTTVQSTGGIPVDDVIDLSIPDFRAPIKFASTVDPQVRKAIEANAKVAQEEIAKDGFNLKAWIDLGTLRKMAGDYKGAETAWLFVTKASSKNPIAYNNLGDLYMNFLKEYPKAESAYLSAIAVNPTDESPYRDLFTMYRDLYKKDSTAAEDILKKGIKAAPDAVDLHVLLARYYKAAGRTADAKVQFEAAISAATKTGQGDIAAQIRVEEGQ